MDTAAMLRRVSPDTAAGWQTPHLWGMPDIHRHLDIWSRIVILITLAMFVAALFLKGFGHDLLLEGGVFLVSVKLIMMAYKNSVATAELNERLDSIEDTVTRIEASLTTHA